jgi:hypothetical protein
MAQLLKLSRCSNPLLLSAIRSSARTFCTPAQPPKAAPAAPAAAASDNSSPLSKGTHRVNEFEKKLLVWTGKYKTVEEIPGYVSQEAVDRARNKFRIRVANIMMLLTLIGCGFMIYSGKNSAERGDSVLKANQDWHREYNERAQKEALEAQAKK